MIQRPSPKIPANSMIPGDRGRGYQYQLVNRYEMMEILRHLEPSFFDGARRGKPRLHKIRSLSANCEAVLLAFGWHFLLKPRPPHCPAPDFVLNFAGHGRPSFTARVRHNGGGNSGDPPGGQPRAPRR